MKPTYFATPAAWRAWLEKHHATETELLVGFYKISTGKPSITWPQSVDEALCFGWIDGKRQSLGDEAYTIRFTPRKPTSIWSAINVAKVAELRAAGKMRPAGEAAYALRIENKTAVYSFERFEAAQFSAAQQAKFEANKNAYAWFTQQSPSYQKVTKHWVTSAKQQATQDRRLAQLIADCAAGKKLEMLTKYASKPKTKKPPKSSPPRAAPSRGRSRR